MPFIMPPAVQTSLVLICPGFADLFAQQPVRLAALERLIAYSAAPTRSPVCSTDLDTWQCELLRALGLGDVAQYPSAPLTWVGAHGAPEAGTWLHADPVVQSISANGLTMSLCEQWAATNLSAVEILVRDHLADSQMKWRVSGGRAYLQMNKPINLQATSVRQASLAALQEALPTGRDALTLRRTMNELQMLLHEKLHYPEAPNAIWLWGAGEMPQLPVKEMPPVWTNDDYTRGVYSAHAAEKRCSPLADVEAILERSNDPRRFAVVRDCAVDALEQRWFAPLLLALDQGRLMSVHIFLDGWQVHACRSVTRRWFARSRPLTESLI